MLGDTNQFIEHIAWERIPLFSRISDEFAKVLAGDAKDAFARAIESSFKLDTTGNVPPKPATPGEIFDEYGFPFVSQKRYGIAIGKDGAFKEFLTPINAPVTQYLYKKLTPAAYEERFKRLPARHNGKQMILTIAEWLHFVPHEFACPLPKVIREHLLQR